MGILDKSKSYRLAGAKLNGTPPRVVKVHLKSHVHLNDINNEAILEPTTSFRESSKQYEDNSLMLQSCNSSLSSVALSSVASSSVAANEATIKERDVSVPGESSSKELVFRLAFPKAMRNMLMSSRCDGSRSSSLPCELGEDALSQLSDICHSGDKNHHNSLNRRQSLKNAMQSRRGSWYTNSASDSRETSNQMVWPGGSFHSFPDRTYLPLSQRKVEVIWNDNYSLNYSKQEDKTPLTDRGASVARDNILSIHNFPYANADQNRCLGLVATPSPLPYSNKPKASKFISKCCM